MYGTMNIKLKNVIDIRDVGVNNNNNNNNFVKALLQQL
jgi:hypothetical protein